MSNARSPRDVCSTTMGTSGLMVLALFRFLGRLESCRRRSLATGLSAACRGLTGLGARALEAAPPASAGLEPGSGSALFSLRRRSLLGRPELLARLGLLERDRLRALDEHVDRLARARSSRSASSGPPCAGARAASPASCPRAAAVGASASSSSSSLGSMPSASTTAASTASRRARCSASGLRLGEDLLLGPAGDLQVGVLVEMPWCDERVQHPVPQLARARVDERVGHVDGRLGDGGVEHRLAELGLDRALLGLAQLVADVLAQLVERVEAGGLGGELVVELGQLLRLDLLDGDLELGVFPGELLGAVVVGEGDVDRALLAGARADRAAPRSRGSAGRRRARSAGRGPRRPRTARRRSSRRSRRRRSRPRSAGRSTGSSRRAARAARSSSRVDASSSASGSRRPTSRPLYVAELRLRAHADLDREGQRLALAGQVAEVELRLADRRRSPAASIASTYQSPSEPRTASSSTASRPSAG